MAMPRHARKIFAVLVLIAATLALSAQTKPLRLVSTVWPPFTNVAGQPLDLVEASLNRLNLPSSTSFVDAAAYTPALLTGAYDGSAAAWKDPAREQALIFSQPYLENRLILIAKHGGNVSAKLFTDLKSRRIAVVEGYAYGDEIEKAGPVFVRSKSEEDSLSLLLAGRADYALMDDLVVRYLVSNYADEARTRLEIGAAPLLTRPLYFAVRRSVPDAQSIIDRFNKQLRTLITDGTYHRLLHVDWIRADVDGDGVAEFVSLSEKSGTAPPQNAYPLFSPGALDQQVKQDQERYFFGGAVYNGWSSVPDRYKVDDLNRPDAVHPTARIFTFSWK
jgi:polar amino acid transport system substrate-binding protein